MAKQVQTRLVDDLDGSEAAETVLLGLDGKAFELDLSEKNAKKLRKALEPFLVAARRSGGGTSAFGNAEVAVRHGLRRTVTAIQRSVIGLVRMAVKLPIGGGSRRR